MKTPTPATCLFGVSVAAMVMLTSVATSASNMYRGSEACRRFPPTPPLPPREEGLLCPAHLDFVRSEAVPISYGLVRFHDPEGWLVEYDHARSCSFPLVSVDAVLGGCMAMCWTHARVLVCDACEAAAQQWLDAHPPPAEMSPGAHRVRWSGQADPLPLPLPAPSGEHEGDDPRGGR